jgi:hypothetical protein
MQVTIHLAFSGGPLSARRRENGGLKAAEPPSTPISPLSAADKMVRQKELNSYRCKSPKAAATFAKSCPV